MLGHHPLLTSVLSPPQQLEPLYNTNADLALEMMSHDAERMARPLEVRAMLCASGLILMRRAVSFSSPQSPSRTEPQPPAVKPARVPRGKGAFAAVCRRLMSIPHSPHGAGGDGVGQASNRRSVLMRWLCAAGEESGGVR